MRVSPPSRKERKLVTVSETTAMPAQGALEPYGRVRTLCRVDVLPAVFAAEDVVDLFPLQVRPLDILCAPPRKCQLCFSIRSQLVSAARVEGARTRFSSGNS